MRKVDAAEFIARLMIVGMQPKAGNGVGNNSPFGQTVIIRPGEKPFLGMWVSHQAGAMASELRAQVATLVARKP